MVGFKFSGLLVLLSLFLVSCMPQNKQTDCSTNEAFSATLRTCVPIIPSSNSFINISSFTPSYNISSYKNNVANIYLAVGISNPYGQAYTLNWRRNYNGMDTAFTDDYSQPLNRNFTPASFSSQVGAHVITVQVINSDNQVVDSHAWTITLTELPTPFLTSPVPLNGSLGNITKSASGLNFNIVGFNNGGTILASTQITWSFDSGIPVGGTECSVSNACYSAGASASSTANYTTIATSAMTVGSHTVTAVLKDASNIYAQFTWTFNVVDPPKAKVTAKYTIDNDSNSNNYVTLARTGVPFTADVAAPFRNFFMTGLSGNTIYNDTQKTNYCLQFERDYGSVTGSYIDVKYYLDGNASPVATVSTIAADSKVCLSDATVAELNNLIFNNANSSAQETHTITARVYDQAIVGVGKEYTLSDFQVGSGVAAYPVSWNVMVKPLNEPPTVSFGATQLANKPFATPLICSGASTSIEKYACEVYTDTNFTVSLLATGDDFYMSPFAAYADGNFTYSLRLYRDSTLVHTCTKTIAAMDATTDASGPEFECTFNIASYGALGPINTDIYTYHIEGEISDIGSPYAAYGAVAKTSTTFKWNLSVFETNNAPSIVSVTPANGSTLTEGTTVNFLVSVDDVDRDNHTQSFYLCLQSAGVDPTCAVNTPIASLTQTSTRNSNAVNATVTSSLNIAENFLHQLTDPSLDCRSLLRGATCAGVRFLVEVKDIPFSPSYSPNVVTSISTYDVINTNPAPLYNESLFAPDESLATHQAISGVPFILSPGAITDASNVLVTAERNTRYQWYSSTDDATWISIPGANSQTLIWTPSSEIVTSGNNTFLKLCMQDQATYVLATVNEEVCTNDPTFGGSTSWAIISNRNYVALDGTVTLPSAIKNQMAVWKGPEQTNTSGDLVTPIYNAYLDSALNIILEKSVLSNTGAYLASGFSRITMNPLDPVLAGSAAIVDIQDLGITGTLNSLYITYRAATTTSPTQYRLFVRRIDIGGTKSHVDFKNNKSFDFSYANPTVVASIPGDVVVGSSTPTDGTWITLNISASTDSTVTINTTDVFTPCLAPCSANAYAIALVSAINSSPSSVVKGIYAVQSGLNEVIIKGVNENDFWYDPSTTIGKMGKPFISGGKLNIIFVNRSLAGGNTDKLSYYQIDVDKQLAVDAKVLAGPITNIQASSYIATSDVITEAAVDYVIVGSIAATGSTARAYKLDVSSYATAPASGILFGNAATTEIKVAASNSVTNYYVIGDAYDTTISSQNFFFTKLDTAMGGAATYKTVTDPTFVDASTQSVFEHSAVSAINIAAYSGGIARVFVVSDNGVAPTRSLYSASFKLDGTLTCHSCQPVAGGIEISTLSPIALSPIRFKTSCAIAPISLTNAHCALGTEGYDSTPGVSTDDANFKDVIFVGYSMLETGPADFQAASAVFNVQSESIQSTALDSVAGKYRPPFFVP